MPDILSSLAQTMPGMPPQTWWLAPAVLFLLGALAVMDAFTGRVPDVVILPGILAVTAVQGFFVEWTFAGIHMAIAFAAGFAIYLINEVWFRIGKRDAIGMGDAKWTMLATTCFGLIPVMLAWGAGACVGLVWMGALRLVRRPVQRVHFAPFLFIGLLAGIYLIRMR